jgi:hypothetical protein
MDRAYLTQTGIIFLFAVSMIFCLVVHAFAGGLEDARRRGRLLVGVKTDFPPLSTTWCWRRSG